MSTKLSRVWTLAWLLKGNNVPTSEWYKSKQQYISK